MKQFWMYTSWEDSVLRLFRQYQKPIFNHLCTIYSPGFKLKSAIVPLVVEARTYFLSRSIKHRVTVYVYCGCVLEFNHVSQLGITWD